MGCTLYVRARVSLSLWVGCGVGWGVCVRGGVGGCTDSVHGPPAHCFGRRGQTRSKIPANGKRNAWTTWGIEARRGYEGTRLRSRDGTILLHDRDATLELRAKADCVSHVFNRLAGAIVTFCKNAADIPGVAVTDCRVF
jgi:hypothetical protein